MTAKDRPPHGGARDGAGRRRRFHDATEPRTLRLPPAFWRYLETLDGSRSAAFVEALGDDDHVKFLRRTLSLS